MARGLGAASAAGVTAMGFVFALSGGGSEGVPASNTFLVFETPTPEALPSDVPRVVLEEMVSATATATATAAEVEPAQQSASPTLGVTAAAARTPGVIALAPAPTATTALLSDFPKYEAIQVLMFAGNARLPSGYTFRECMELPPVGDGWPGAVHLYYEGRGRWLVETHVSDVQVVFDEATGTFSVRTFAPANAACLRR